MISYLTSSKRKRRIIVHDFGHSLWSAISCQGKWSNGNRADSKFSLDRFRFTIVVNLMSTHCGLMLLDGITKHCLEIHFCLFTTVCRLDWSNTNRKNESSPDKDVSLPLRHEIDPFKRNHTDLIFVR